MEKKNNKLFIIVGVLLVIVVGVTFAYFAARLRLNGEGAKTEIHTAIAGDTTITTEGSISFEDLDIYPGHQNISKLKVTAVGTREISYNLIWTGTNTINTTLNYKVYKTTSNEAPSITCTKKEEGALTKILYETCVYNNFDNLGSVISSGEITTTSEAKKFILKENESIQATEAGETVYYYVVLEYPNKEESQNIDSKGSLTGEVNIELLDKDPVITKDDIIANSNPMTGKDTFTGTSETDDTEAGLYTTEDDDGTTYYYRGNVTNNWVKFGKYPDDTPDIYYGYYSESSLAAKSYNSLSECENATSYNYNCTSVSNAGKDMYWRIIRINGDGSIRMIYNGTTTAQTDIGTQISKNFYNADNKDNAYVGYMYGTVGSSTYAATHANTNDGTIKGVLDNWYKVYILHKGYSDKVDTNAGFCNDRKIYTGASWNGAGLLGYGANTTTYEPASRFVQWSSGSYSFRTTQNPTFKCSQENDLYTVSGANKGNRALQYPVGLITADEVVFAGGFGGTFTNGYYLYTGQDYWTMSPAEYQGTAVVLNVDSNGRLNRVLGVRNTLGVRPVINLKPDTTFTGNGTVSNPYVVVQ